MGWQAVTVLVVIHLRKAAGSGKAVTGHSVGQQEPDLECRNAKFTKFNQNFCGPAAWELLALCELYSVAVASGPRSLGEWVLPKIRGTILWGP